MDDWWGYSKRHGWIYIDREIDCNHKSGSNMIIIRCSDNSAYVELKYRAGDNFGITGVTGSNKIFELGSTNQIASWSFDNTKIISNLGINSQTEPGIVIKSEGTIETDPFISGLTACPASEAALIKDLNKGLSFFD